MKVTFIGSLPPFKAASPYCLGLSKALSKKVDLEFIGLESPLLNGSRAMRRNFMSDSLLEEKKKINNAYNLNLINPFTWVNVGLHTKGEIAHIQLWGWWVGLFFWIFFPILKLRGKKIVLSVHNITPHIVISKKVYWLMLTTDRFIKKLIFPYVDRFIVHNARNKKQIMELYNIDSNKISIIPHGALQPHNILNISKDEARELLNLPKNRHIILHFGYIREDKGIDLLLGSLVYIKKEIPDVILLIAGQCLTSWSTFDAIIKKYNLQENVILKLEYVPDSQTELYFSASDLVALSYKEPFDTHGGVGSLSLTFKKPMIVTSVGGLNEYVKDEKVIVKPNDILDLSNKIISVLRDDALLEKLSKDSEMLAEELSWDNIADKTIEIYKQII